MKVRLDVTPRRDVLDPQGQAVHHALHSLGFNSVTNVRIGKVIELDLDVTDPQIARSQALEMADKMLANQVIEDFIVREIVE